MSRVDRVTSAIWGLVCLVLAAAAAAAADSLTTGPPSKAGSHCTGHGYIPEPLDCRMFYRCVHGRMVPQRCQRLTVFSPDLSVCVHAGSELDKCTPQRPIQECARGNVEFIPHPTECHHYWNCSKSSQSTQFISECPYPQGFDITLKTCVDYKTVTCGAGRHLPTWQCQYARNQCSRGSHCIPCSARYPSCVGKADGHQADEWRLWSPYFITCQGERAISYQKCTRDESTAMAKLFHPDRRQCLTLWQIPREHLGLEPSCEGKQAGEYTVVETPFMMYRCPGRELFYCQIPSNLDHDMSQCSPFDA